MRKGSLLLEDDNPMQYDYLCISSFKVAVQRKL